MAAGVPSPSSSESSARLPVWLRPVPIAVAIMIFTVLMAYYMTPTTYHVQYREPKYVSGATVWWVVYLTIAFCIPALVVAAERMDSQPWRSWDFSEAEHRTLQRLATGFFILTVIGYMIWLAHAAGNGFHFSAVSRTLSGTSSQSSTNKQQLTTVSGLTTMAQFGIPMVVIGALTWRKTTRAVRVMTLIVIAIGLYRALAASERLAGYELLLPVLVIIAARAYHGPGTALERRRRRLAIRAVPLVAVPLLILSFAGFEYTRSWSYYRHHTQDSFWAYETKRLGGYYATSYNNAQMMHDNALWPEPGAPPWFTWYGIWNFPVFKNFVKYDKIAGGSDFFATYDDALSRYANPEFNNFGGMTNVTFDYGWVGGAIFIAVIGGFVGAAYAAFAQRRRWGLLFYPILIVFLIELPREWYMSNGRAIPAFAGVLITAMALRRVRHREHRRGEQLTGVSESHVGFAGSQQVAHATGPPAAPA